MVKFVIKRYEPNQYGHGMDVSKYELDSNGNVRTDKNIVSSFTFSSFPTAEERDKYAQEMARFFDWELV